jgi:hypothetical protein
MGLERLTQNHQFDGDVTIRGRVLSGAGGVDIYSIITSLGGGSLTNTINTSLVVGALTAGSVLASGTTFQSFAERLLTTTFNPTYTPPTVTLTSNHSSIVEAGTQGITLTVNFNRGSINGALVGGIWQPSTFQNFRAGAASNYTIINIDNGTNNELTSATAIVSDGANVYGATLNHNQGPQPTNSQSNPVDSPYPAALSAVSLTVTGRRRMFYGADTVNSIPTTSNEIRGLGQNFLNPANGSTFTVANTRALTIPAGTRRVIIAYPDTLQNLTSVKYIEAGNA